MINYFNKIDKGQIMGEILSIVFLCAVIPFLYTNYTIDPVLHPRFVAWTIFLIGSISIYFICNRSDSLNDTLVIQKYHLLLVGFVVISLVSIFKAVNVSEAAFDFLKNFCFLISFIIFFNLFRNHGRAFDNISLGMSLAGLITGVIVLIDIINSLADYRKKVS